MVWNGWFNFKISVHLCRSRRYLWGITRIVLIKSKSAPPMKTNFKICFTLRRYNCLTIKLWVIPPKLWNQQETKPVKFRSYANGLKLVRNGNNKKTIKQDLYSQHLGSNMQWYYHSCFCQHDSRISFYAEKMYMHVTISLLNTYTPHINTSP